jgi:glucokinase
VGVALGIDIGGTKIRAGLVDEKGAIGQIKEMATEAEQGGYHIIDRLLTLIDAYSGTPVLGIGIGTSGQVGLDGSILSATHTFPEWAGIALEKIIAGKTGYPARVINDVQAMALGELYFGEGRSVHHFLCLALGTGVGGAIVIDRKLYRGESGSAGEFGHLVIRSGGAPCPCGKKGCLEAYVSGAGLVRRYKEKTGQNKTTYDFLHDVRAGHKEAAALFNECMDDLICGLSSLCEMFNPQKIILGGGLAGAFQDYLPYITGRMKGQISFSSASCIELSSSFLGGNAMLLGAAGLILKGGHEK